MPAFSPFFSPFLIQGTIHVVRYGQHVITRFMDPRARAIVAAAFWWTQSAHELARPHLAGIQRNELLGAFRFVSIVSWF